MGFPAPAAADVAAGVAAYLQRDYASALLLFQESAKRDDARALNYLGIMYADGIGTARDDRQAATLFSKAALLGFPEAMANLARMHGEGRGMPQDYKAAVAAYRGAARAGFAPAIERMAEIYEKGELGEPRNAALAREWRTRLAQQSRPAGVPVPAPKTAVAVASPPPKPPVPAVVQPVPAVAPTPVTTAPASAPIEKPAVAKNAIEAVAVTAQSLQIQIRVRTKLPLTAPPFGFVVAMPPRIAFDFPQTETGLGRHHPVGEGELQSMEIVQGGGRTRMVLILREAMQHNMAVDGRDLLITLIKTAP